MTVVGRQVTVGTTPTKIADNGGSADPIRARVNNTDATNSVFLGGATVAAAGGNAGYELKFGVEREFALDPGEVLYAIVTAGTVRVDALTSG